MSLESAAEIATKVSKVFIDKDSLVNKTNVSSGAGVICMGIAAKLALIPEPHAQIAAGVLGVAGFIISLIHKKEPATGV